VSRFRVPGPPSPQERHIRPDAHITAVERREKILRIICERPGIHVRALIRETGVKNGAILHHLKRLEAEGRVRSQRYSRYRRYYPADVSEEEMQVIRNIKNPAKKDVLFRIMVEGYPSFRELTSKTGKSSGALSWNLSGLIDEGVVEKCKMDGRYCYRIKDRDLFKKTFADKFARLFDETAEHAEDIFLAL